MTTIAKEQLDSFVIGTTQAFQTFVAGQAETLNLPRAEFGGQMATQGLAAFEADSLTKSPTRLLADMETALACFEGQGKSMWPIVLDRKAAIRLKLAAKEYEMSVSRFAACLIASALDQKESIA
jgi:hypothetical protein